MVIVYHTAINVKFSHRYSSKLEPIAHYMDAPLLVVSGITFRFDRNTMKTLDKTFIQSYNLSEISDLESISNQKQLELFSMEYGRLRVYIYHITALGRSTLYNIYYQDNG